MIGDILIPYKRFRFLPISALALIFKHFWTIIVYSWSTSSTQFLFEFRSAPRVICIEKSRKRQIPKRATILLPKVFCSVWNKYKKYIRNNGFCVFRSWLCTPWGGVLLDLLTPQLTLPCTLNLKGNISANGQIQQSVALNGQVLAKTRLKTISVYKRELRLFWRSIFAFPKSYWPNFTIYNGI